MSPLVLVFLASSLALVLVTVPDFPARVQGIFQGGIAPFFNRIAQLGKDVLSNHKSHPREIAQTASSSSREKAVSVDEVGLVEHAEQQLLAQIQKRPDEPAYYNQLALIYASTSEFEKAVVYLQKTIELSRLRIAQLAELERQYRAHGEISMASQTVLDRSRIDVELSAAHGSLARVYDQLGQHDKAAAQLEQLNGDIAFGSALTAKLAVNPIDAGSASAASHRLSLPVLRLLAQAEGLMQAHRVAQAAAIYKQVIQLDPLATLAHKRLGMIVLAQDNFYLGKQELETAARLDPDDAATHFSLGSAYQQNDDTDRAVEEYEKALALNPKLAEAAANLGNTLCTARRFPQAQEAYAKLTKMQPDSAVAHNNLATVMSMNGDYKGAIDEFEHALMIEPGAASSHYGLGLAFYHTDSYSACIREFKKALALDPGLTDAQTKLQLACRKAAGTSGFPVN
jgi:tetratricopeptide (TPR) repeat protein